jgi:prevent-host-death family protein
LRSVTTCDYIGLVKKKTPAQYRLDPAAAAPAVMKEVAALPGWGNAISVRAAKAHLSGLLELVASAGKEFVITSDGKPKARIVPAEAKPKRQGFQPDWALLKSMPMQTEPPLAEDLIRADRDGRGW